MQQKHKRHKLGRYAAAALLFLIIAVASTVIFTKHSHTDAAPVVKPVVSTTVPSKFSFSSAANWTQGATNATSMALFHIPHDCFTSAQYKTGTVDIMAELQEQQNTLVASGYVVTPGVTQTLTMQTATGAKPYELHQSSVISPASASAVEGGQEFGYLQLAKGYVFIEGYCDTPAELPATIPALQAIKFDVTKWTSSVSHLNS